MDFDDDVATIRLVARMICGTVGIGLLVLLGSTWLISYSFDSNFHYQGWEMAGSGMPWIDDDPSSSQSFWGATFPELAVMLGVVTMLAVSVYPTLHTTWAGVAGSMAAFAGAVSFDSVNGELDNVSVTGAVWSLGVVSLVGVVMSVIVLRKRPR